MASSSPREARRAHELELRRADVLAAATAVFAERGFDGALVGDIARRAEVSNSTIYALFDGKEELYRATLAEISHGIRARVDAAVAPIEDPVERLLATVDALCDTFEEDRTRLRLFLRDRDAVPWKIRENLGDDGRAIYRSFADGVTKAAASAHEQGRLRVLSPSTFAHFLLGSVATALTRSIEDAPDRSLIELGAELRAGIARLFEEPA